jgi:uridine kinase
MKAPYLVGITGGSGSGKTYFLERLVERLGNGIGMISQDNYYRTRAQQPKDANGIENFDLPESLDLAKFAQDLGRLKSGERVEREEYTYNNKAKIPKLLVFEPKPVIVVEGIFILHSEEVRRMLDLKVFIDVKDHIKLTRRILRDQKERGYPLEDVLYRFENHVMPTYERYIERHRGDADLVVNNNSQGIDQALDVLSTFLLAKIASSASNQPS